MLRDGWEGVGAEVDDGRGGEAEDRTSRMEEKTKEKEEFRETDFLYGQTTGILRASGCSSETTSQFTL